MPIQEYKKSLQLYEMENGSFVNLEYVQTVSGLSADGGRFLVILSSGQRLEMLGEMHGPFLLQLSEYMQTLEWRKNERD